jgi:hypothetical protein
LKKNFHLPSSGIRFFFNHVPQVNSKKFSHGGTVSSILSSKEFAIKFQKEIHLFAQIQQTRFNTIWS